MSSTRRLASLNLVHRVKTHTLETIGAELSELRAQQADITAKQSALSEQVAFEAANTTSDSYAFLSGYLQSADRRQQHLAAQLAELEDRASAIEGQLLEAFRDVKTNEAVKGQTVQEIKQHAERSEVQELDDANRALYLLKKSGKT